MQYIENVVGALSAHCKGLSDNGHRLFSNYPFCHISLDDPFTAIKPDNGPRWAAFNSNFRGQVIFFIIDLGQIGLNGDQPFRGIGGASIAGIADDFTFRFRRIAGILVFTRDPEAMADRLKGEEFLGADFDTVIAGGTFEWIHHW